MPGGPAAARLAAGPPESPTGGRLAGYRPDGHAGPPSPRLAEDRPPDTADPFPRPGHSLDRGCYPAQSHNAKPVAERIQRGESALIVVGQGPVGGPEHLAQLLVGVAIEVRHDVKSF